MQPNSQQQPSSLPSWFSTPQTPSPSPQKTGKKKFILLIALAVVLLIAMGTSLFLTSKRSSDMCLTRDDYKALVGSSTTDTLQPNQNFYTFYVDFADNTTTFSSLDGRNANETIKKMGDFYKSHPNKTILFSISLDAATGKTDLAQQRITALKKALSAAGISESVISNSEPDELAQQEDEGLEFADTAAITITSADTCESL